MENISVWNRPWLPDTVRLQPVTEVQVMWDALMVTHLFQPNKKEWNENFIWYVFDTGTTNQIINTPLFPSVRVDKATWRFERNGCYSVRSAIGTSLITTLACYNIEYLVIGVLFGSLNFLQRLRISSGDYAAIVFQPVCVYKQKE